MQDRWTSSVSLLPEVSRGVKLNSTELNSPDQGWDGKYKGKYVKTGTYFYVIEARGADGVEYKLKGDINILNYTGTGRSSSSGMTE